MIYTNPIQNALDTQGFVVLDGALATQLEVKGAFLQDQLWSAKLLVENPGLIKQVHYEYFYHGADVATTASYQATFEGFAKRGLDNKKAIALLQLSVQLANEARDEFWKVANPKQRIWPLIAASIGPYGAMLADGSEYRGNYGLDVKALMDFHRPRLEVLLESGADLLACETIPSLREAEAIISLLKEYPQARAWLSFSCCDEQHICDGTTLKTVMALTMHVDQVVAVGINCTAPHLVSPLLDSVKGATSKPLIVYPNSGEGWDAINKSWLPSEASADLKPSIEKWFQQGARLIGGCCRMGPHDITTIRETLQLSKI